VDALFFFEGGFMTTSKPIFRILATASLLAAGSCATLDDQAPKEFHEAKTAIRDAQRADIDDTMPRAMEAAERKYAHAVNLLDDSADLYEDGKHSQSEAARTEAVKAAVEARDIARGGIQIVGAVDNYNANIGEYLTLERRAADSERLAGENNVLREQNTALQAQVNDLALDNNSLSNQPPETMIPADFRVEKAIAFFSVGSTTLNPEARREVETLADLLKRNDQLSVTLEGFADPTGSAEANLKLAEKRINAVATALAQKGVAKDRVTMNAVGETTDDPTNVSKGRMQLDRKVVAKVEVIAH
jgi:outer membrane protein OmpA-like peptidoglycan-associated protein